MIPRSLSWRICGAIFILITACTAAALDRSNEIRTGNNPDDPVGAWKLKCVSPDGKTRECVVTVFREGSGLKGHYTADGLTKPAKKVVFEEGLLSVDVDGRFANQLYGLTYKGAPRGDSLHGSVRWSFGWASGSFAFHGERAEQQVASAP